MLAMAIFALISVTMITLATGGFVSLEQGGEQTEAEALAQEGIEAVRAIRDGAWNVLTYATSSVSVTGTDWIFDGENTTETIGQYTRTISFASVCRDSSHTITTCPGSYTDIHTKQATVIVSWETRPGISNQVQKTTYLTNWDSRDWIQTDWIGSSGQSMWSDITRYDSDDGNLDSTTAGEIKLKNSGSSCGSKSWSFDTASDYTFDSNKIDVANSLAQLKSSSGGGIDGNTKGLWHLDESSGTVVDYSGNLNDLTNVKGSPVYNQSGKFATAVQFNGNSSRFINNGQQTGLGIAGAITIDAWIYRTAAATTVEGVITKWRETGDKRSYALAIDATNRLKFYLSSDGSSEFTVTATNQVPLNSWVHVAAVYNGVNMYIFQNGVLENTLAYSSGIADQAAFVGISGADVLNGGDAFFNGKIDEARVSNVARWTASFTPPSNAYGGSASYASDNPSINPTTAHTVSGIATWSSFTETATKNGGEIYYQLSDDGGTTWKYWNGAWTTAGASDYNIASIINTNIGSFTTTTAQIMFKAFLSGNGTQQVILDNVQVSCEKQFDWPFTTANDYTYDSAKITVTSGKASLVDQGGGGSCSGTATACTTFGTSPLCTAQNGCSWGGATSGATTNPSFDVNSTGWTYADWEDGARASGTRITTGGNPNGYINISLSRTNPASTASGYWQQPFTTTVANPTSATVSFDWKIVGYNGTFLTSYIIYVFVDNTSGAPTIGNQVWSQTITGTTGWVTVSNLNVASKLTTAGTYYIKLVARRIKPTGNPPTTLNTVGWDNVSLNWSKTDSCSGTPTACNTYGTSPTCSAQGGCIWTGAALYPTDKPTVYPSVSLSVASTSLNNWSTFIETATKNGGEIYYQLSDDDGSTWQYWNGGAWATAGGANYNIATDINTNISIFPTSTGKLMVKAFLSSNGTQLVELDNVRVGWGESGGGGGYATAGYFVSSAFTMGDASPVQILSWTEDLGSCATCDIKLQLRTAPNNGGVPGTWGSWYGVAGVDTYYTSPSEILLSTILNGNEWMQYRAELVGDGVMTPILREVKVNYK